MEILNFILTLLSDNANIKKIMPIISLIKDNNFDIKKVLENINIDTLAPIIKEFLSASPINNINEKSKEENLIAIKNVATDEIVATLNSYFNN